MSVPVNELEGDAIVGKTKREEIEYSVKNNGNILHPPETEMLALDSYRKSPNRGAGASRPKRCYTSPQGEIYFKATSKNPV